MWTGTELPLLIREIVFIEISGRCVNLRQGKKFVNSLEICDREKGFKILALDATHRYDSTQGFVITDVELAKLGREVG